MDVPLRRVDAVRPAVFDPASDVVAEGGGGWTGERRRYEKAPSQRLVMPKKDLKARYDAFDAWHVVAMQILHEARKSFRAIAAFKIVFNWKAGLIAVTDEQLAARCGRCCVKTISRDLQDYAALGLIQIEGGWRKNAQGGFARKRSIRLALPNQLPVGVILPDDLCETDHSGPDGAAR